jgi:hypothetical protein
MSRTLLRRLLRVMLAAGAVIVYGRLLLFGWAGVLQLFE